MLETTVDRLDARQLPWRRATLLYDLARLRERAGDRAGAIVDARAAGAVMATLDVVPAPGDVELLARLDAAGPGTSQGVRTAELACEGKWWAASFDGSSVRLPDTKGLRYLAALLTCAGAERHVMDLVDRVEGIEQRGGVDRRALGDAGEALDTRARTAYRRRIEQLRAEADDALAAGRLEAAEACQDELDQLVRQLASAFGLGGRDRRAASAAERARLNVTRALRSAITKLVDTVPDAGAVLDRRVRTGLYCVYAPDAADAVRWVVRP
jgi:hypothetical protein